MNELVYGACCKRFGNDTLIMPGWYGMASVKWLERIEVHPACYMGRFMADHYVMLRSEERDNVTYWTRNAIGAYRLKSVPGQARGADGRYRIIGAAWGSPIERVELRIDKGEWRETTLDRSDNAEHAWVFWSFDWKNVASGNIQSRRAPSTPTAMSNLLRKTQSSPISTPIGKATVK